jgi:hypothetical protein
MKHTNSEKVVYITVFWKVNLTWISVIGNRSTIVFLNFLSSIDEQMYVSCFMVCLWVKPH